MTTSEQHKKRNDEEIVAMANVLNAIDALLIALKNTRHHGAIGRISDALYSSRSAHAMLQEREEREERER